MRCFALFLILGSGIVPTLSVECNIRESYRCMELINKITKNNECPELAAATSCVEKLTKACEEYDNPTCEDRYMSCDFFDGSHQAPMSSYYHRPSLCSIRDGMTQCHKKRCDDPSARKSEGMDHNVPSDGENCPAEAIKKCLPPIAEVTEVNKKTCILAGKAKNCILDALCYCGGSDLDQIAVDVSISGLNRHVMQCRIKDYGFSEDGGICVPNPIDAFLSKKDYLDQVSGKSEKPVQEIGPEYCRKVHHLGKMFEQFYLLCNSTKYNEDYVRQQLSELNGPRLHCYEAGFPPNQGGSNRQTAWLALIIALIAVVIPRGE